MIRPLIEVSPPRETGRLVESLPRSSDDNWSTPIWLLELIFPDGRYFDPCPINPEGLRESDGMGPWPVDVPVFLNPPYSDPAPWLKRAAAHPGPVVCLVRCDPSASWWAYSEGFQGHADRAAPEVWEGADRGAVRERGVEEGVTAGISALWDKRPAAGSEHRERGEIETGPDEGGSRDIKRDLRYGTSVENPYDCCGPVETEPYESEENPEEPSYRMAPLQDYEWRARPRLGFGHAKSQMRGSR